MEAALFAAVSNSAEPCATDLYLCVCMCTRGHEAKDIKTVSTVFFLGDGQNEISKQSVSWFGQPSIRSRTERRIACFANRRQTKGSHFFSRQALIRVLIVGDHASKSRLTSLAVIRANLVTEKWTSRCLVACLGDMEPCEPPSTHKIVHCSLEARVAE